MKIPMDISLSPRSALVAMMYIITVLLIANIAGLIYTINFDPVNFIAMLFDFNTEKNIPTLYSCFALIIASLILLLIGYLHRKRNNPYLAWYGLSAIFAFLSVDEMASLHEYLNSFFELSGVFYYAWLIPYAITLIALSFIYIPFVIKLPIRFTKLFVISGFIFVMGAMGFEMLGGLQEQSAGVDSTLYCVYYTIEEFCEMLGIALFIYALLTYIRSEFKNVKFSVT